MAQGVLRVFLSHTSELRSYPDPRSFVAAAEEAVQAVEGAVLDMKHFTAQNLAPAAYCRKKLEDVDIYVGIIGFRYGTPVRGDPKHSYTELEFAAATELDKTRLVFLLDEKATLPLPRDYLSDPKYEKRQQAFRARLQDESEVTVQRVGSPDQLAMKLTQALSQQPDPVANPPPEEQTAASSTATLPTLAREAQQELQRALSLLQQAARAMEQIEHGYAKPAGMDAWENWDDKERKHEQLAASVIDPAGSLKSRADEASQVVEDARKHVSELSARRFTARAASLRPISGMVSELQSMSGQLVDRVVRARDELGERAEDYPDYYQASYLALSQTYDSIDQANASAIRMERALSRPRAPLETGDMPAAQPEEPLAAPPAEQPDQDGLPFARARPAEASPSAGVSASAGERTIGGGVRYLDVGGKTAAGPPVMSAGVESEALPVPAERVRGSHVEALKVVGTSMEGNGVREGDYVIMDPDRSRDDGDMVVVRAEGLGGPEESLAIVKRLRLNPDGTFRRLESSDPDDAEEYVGPEDNPVIAGRVIGIYRVVP